MLLFLSILLFFYLSFIKFPLFFPLHLRKNEEQGTDHIISNFSKAVFLLIVFEYFLPYNIDSLHVTEAFITAEIKEVFR